MPHQRAASGRRTIPGYTEHSMFPAHVDFPGTAAEKICRGCSYSDDGLPLAPVPYPCPPIRLAGAVKERRRKLGLTVKQLAVMAGVSERAIAYIEGGGTNHSPRPETFVALDRGLLWRAGSARRVYETGGQPSVRPREVPRDVPPEVQVIMRAGLPLPVESALLSHLAARRQDMEAALESEATLLVSQAGMLLRPSVAPDEDL